MVGPLNSLLHTRGGTNGVLDVSTPSPSSLLSTKRTSPSLPGLASIMHPRGHSPRLVLGSITSTTSPSFKLCFGWNHFFRTLRLGRNSFLQRFQNCPNSCWTRCHRFRGLKTSSWSSASGANCPSIFSTRKWFGQWRKIFGSALTRSLAKNSQNARPRK